MHFRPTTLLFGLLLALLATASSAFEKRNFADIATWSDAQPAAPISPPPQVKAALLDIPVATNTTNPLDAIGGFTTGELNKLTAYTAVWGGVMIASGIALVFFGHKLYRPLLFLGGFYFFAGLTFVIMQNIEVSRQELFHNRDLVYFICCIVFGLIGGGLAVFFWKLAFFVIGAGLGYALALIVLTALSGVFTNNVARYVLIAAFCLIFGFLIFWLETPLLIAATAVGGSYIAFMGIDVFARTGFVEISQDILTGQSIHADITTKWAWMLAGCVLVALLGAGFQIHQVKQSGGKTTASMQRNLATKSQMKQAPRYQQV
ncbi:hypothetical protein HDU98_000871 [Podochytrium sp. JEL0797]|nr:hypothetical protein HDU98_000871 [Podochytrium sp. JEL0797]